MLPQVCVSEELLDYAATTASVTLLAYSPLLGGAYARAEHALPREYATSDSGFDGKPCRARPGRGGYRAAALSLPG